MMGLMLTPVAPVLAPLAAAARRTWYRLCLAALRQALRERVGPMHPDRLDIERRVIHYERLLAQ